MAVESRKRVSSYLGLVSWMDLHPAPDIHSETRTQYCSIQTPSRYPLLSSYSQLLVR
ncbi:unnamed protein product [Schistosoma margrebowiei]|uniref:Uncharacterized protein n=1 Tax=Schistosoma margrebowiei TaxID=48269 RepID=A0A3P8BW69_9TREM|nr:unnamed protein product [Schistosoma margrebowiei]